mmetsp:Transcript_50076/g.98949  ORF Transcript_50076/g.98949 Transcript_50076/m.98949 type:complete len:206 (+) Transcript_50076:455-1072(+)
MQDIQEAAGTVQVCAWIRMLESQDLPMLTDRRAHLIASELRVSGAEHAEVHLIVEVKVRRFQKEHKVLLPLTPTVEARHAGNRAAPAEAAALGELHLLLLEPADDLLVNWEIEDPIDHFAVADGRREDILVGLDLAPVLEFLLPVLIGPRLHLVPLVCEGRILRSLLRLRVRGSAVHVLAVATACGGAAGGSGAGDGGFGVDAVG